MMMKLKVQHAHRLLQEWQKYKLPVRACQQKTCPAADKIECPLLI